MPRCTMPAEDLAPGPVWPARPASRCCVRIGSLLAPYRWWLALVLVTVLVSALGAIAPFLTRAVFDDALFPVGADGLDRVARSRAAVLAGRRPDRDTPGQRADRGGRPT